jgi:two-component system LytT family response regulator
MIRAYVVDDELPAVRRLVRLLEATGRVEIAGSSTDPVEALAYLRTHTIDVVFLDVQMPEIDGFELLQHLASPVPVVFVTAFDRYAIDAFDVDSVDYLLKPVDEDRLARTLKRLERFSAAERVDVAALARQLATRLAPRRPERISSRSGERTTMLDLARVSYFAAREKTTFAVVEGREYPIDESLADLEARLDPKRFMRIHRSTIVNVATVQEIDRWVDGGALVRLKDPKKTELPVARDRVRELKMRLGIVR